MYNGSYFCFHLFGLGKMKRKLSYTLSIFHNEIEKKWPERHMISMYLSIQSKLRELHCWIHFGEQTLCRGYIFSAAAVCKGKHRISNRGVRYDKHQCYCLKCWLLANIFIPCLFKGLKLVDICDVLTHWGRVTHICVSNLTIIGPDNGLSPGRRQAIIWTNAGILFIESLGTNYSEILIRIHTFSFKKMHLKMSSAKWRPCCLGLNVLNENAVLNETHGVHGQFVAAYHSMTRGSWQTSNTLNR